LRRSGFEDRVCPGNRQPTFDTVGGLFRVDVVRDGGAGLNPGGRILDLIQQPTTVSAVLDTFLAESDVEPGWCGHN
jgi:hypothetical protein